MMSIGSIDVIYLLLLRLIDFTSCAAAEDARSGIRIRPPLAAAGPRPARPPGAGQPAAGGGSSGHSGLPPAPVELNR